MKQALIFVPIFFLVALIAIGTMLYSNTNTRAGCTGEDCDELSDVEYIDMTLEARS